MTTGRALMLAIATFGLGVWVGPHLSGGAPERPEVSQQATVEVPPPVETPPAAPVRRPAARRATRPAIAATSADLRARLQPVLNKGTNMDVAAQGFRDGEHFATLAHAARNTEVPFVLLKHRVLNEGKSLAAAIRESKPAIDAAVQADLAVAQARADIATIQG